MLQKIVAPLVGALFVRAPVLPKSAADYYYYYYLFIYLLLLFTGECGVVMFSVASVCVSVCL